MAIVSERHQPRQEDIGRLLQEQKLLSNRDLLSRNFDEVIQNLNDCDEYIEGIIVSVIFHLFAILLAMELSIYLLLPWFQSLFVRVF